MQVKAHTLVKTVAILTLMASGRAMTLAFVSRAGDGGAGDPPAAWLMPLLGDAIVGLGAVLVGFLLWRRPSPATWLIAVVWDSVAIFDAGAAYLIDLAEPWPAFFMLELFGRSMFLGAILLHLTIFALLMGDTVRNHYGVSTSPAKAAI